MAHIFIPQVFPKFAEFFFFVKNDLIVLTFIK